MKRTSITEDAYVEKKMTAGVRHAKTFCTVIAILMAALYVAMLFFNEAKHSGECLTIVIGFMLCRWLFDGLESIISLLCDLNSMPFVGTKFPDAAFPQRPAPTSAPQQPMTHDDPAHWPKQEPVNTGIDVEAALRAAKEISRN